MNVSFECELCSHPARQCVGGVEAKVLRREGPRSRGPLVLFGWLDSLDHDAAGCHERRDGADGCQPGSEHGSSHSYGQWELDDGVFTLLDADPADVPFIEQPFELSEQAITVDLELLGPGLLLRL